MCVAQALKYSWELSFDKCFSYREKGILFGMVSKTLHDFVFSRKLQIAVPPSHCIQILKTRTILIVQKKCSMFGFLKTFFNWPRPPHHLYRKDKKRAFSILQGSVNLRHFTKQHEHQIRKLI